MRLFYNDKRDHASIVMGEVGHHYWSLITINQDYLITINLSFIIDPHGPIDSTTNIGRNFICSRRLDLTH